MPTILPEGGRPGMGVQQAHQSELVAQTLVVASELTQDLAGDLEQGVAGPSKVVLDKDP